MAFLGCILAYSVIQLATSAPIPIEMVDLTYTFNNDTLHWPEEKKFEIKVKINGTTDGGYWLQMEEYNTGIHVGTHMDAPCHFARGRWTVDEIPLDHLIAPAAVIDITRKAEQNRDYLVTIKDLEEWERRTQHSLDGTIIVLKSGWGSRWGNKEAFTGTPNNDVSKLHFPGMSQEAAKWLVDNRSIFGLGTEALSLDHGPSRDFMAHRNLLGANIFGLENMANVKDLPMIGAMLYVMPMKIGRASGAPVRIIATYPKVMFPQRDGKAVGDGTLREVIIFS
ncbi:isatin hydrolase-like [Uloborus diversus]|uniref:isatin hydrolase-like n=1 Tax=Uloborus diversus TaxID=327109 RepID=UPI002409F761|nr:isatin hydrolase-like [Uloborus diversus]